MNIWITGSTGFIGSHIVDNLLKKGHKVTCFSNNKKAINDDISINKQLNYLDFSSKDNIKELIKGRGCPEKFIHLGWGDMTVPMSDIHLTKNVDNSKNLIEELFLAGLSTFIFVGSMNEYGSRIGALDEAMKPEGRLINYAKGKIKVSKYGFDRARYHNKIFIHTRPFYVFGPGQREGSLINDLFKSATLKVDPVLGPCNYYRDYIYVKDVAEGITRCMDIKKSMIVNLGLGSYIMVQDFVRTFWSFLEQDKNKLIFGKKGMMSDEPDQPKSYANTSKLEECTNWKPEYSIERGIKDTISVLKRNL